MTRTVIVAIAFLAAGIALAVAGAYQARSEPMPEFGYGVVFASPQSPKEPAEGEPAPSSPASPSPGKPWELEPFFSLLSAEDIHAAEEALAPLEPQGFLPIRMVYSLVYTSEGAIPYKLPVTIAIVADEDADRVLAPLCGPGTGAAPIYATRGLPLAEILADAGLTAEVSDRLSADLPISARVFRDAIFIRRSAAASLGIKVKGEEPNALAMALGRPGQLEEAVRLVQPLRASNNLRLDATDMAISRGSTAWWLGVAGLAMILVAGAVFVGGTVTGLAGRPEPERAGLAPLHAGLKLLSERRELFHYALAAMTVAMIVGGCIGAPWPFVPFIQQSAPLAQVGLETLGLGGMALVNIVLMAFLFYFLVVGLAVISASSLLPGIGPALAGVGVFIWGVTLAPSTLTMLDRLPLRAVVATLACQAYAILVVGGIGIFLGVARPKNFGVQNRWLGYKMGVLLLYRLIPLSGVLMGAAVLLGAILLAVMSHLK